jgi:hypothetical protein
MSDVETSFANSRKPTLQANTLELVVAPYRRR